MEPVDLDAYLARIAVDGSREPTLDLLDRIVLGHATHIPFENLDLHRGLSLSLEPPALVDKLVTRRRGGYCFEQNTLLLAALRALGFEARPLAARVLYGAAPVARPRTHMLLVVDVRSRSFLADVGFGAHNLLAPLPFEPGRPRDVLGETFRIREIPWNGKVLAAPPAFELEVASGGGFAPLYRLSLEDQQPVDFEMANFFASTHPASLFVRTKIVSLPAVDARAMLVDRELTITRPGKDAERELLADDASYAAALARVFGLTLDPDPPLRWGG